MATRNSTQRPIVSRQLTLDPGLLVVLALPLFAIIPLLTHAGLPKTADGPAHLMRQVELNLAWQDGIFFPRWAPALAYGYGAPLFSYAPPLLYALTQALHLTGMALDTAMKGVIILMLLVYSVGAYLLVREIFGAPAGIVAAAAYVYAPYRLRETYIQGNYGQLCGLALYPLILWAFLRLAATRQLKYLLAAALSLALLLLSHNISAMLFFPLLAVYLLLLWKIHSKGDVKRTHPRWQLPLLFTSAVSIGLGLSAFFWLPAFLERDTIRLAGITQGFFDFRHNFISLTELLALPRPLDLASINPYFPLSLGVAQILLALLALVTLPLLLLRRTQDDTHSPAPRAHSLALFFAAAFLVYSFLGLPQSTPVWMNVPLLELAEFPWRMLGPSLLCAAVLAGSATDVLQRHINRRYPEVQSVFLVTAGLLLVVGANLVYLFPDQFIPWGSPTQVDVMAYEVESGAIGTTSTGEFLPAGVESFPSPQVFALPYIQARAAGEARPDIPYIEPGALPAGARVETLSHTARNLILRVNTPTSFNAHFRLLYWPGWQVFLSPELDPAQPQVWTPAEEVSVSSPDGQVNAQLPAGEYLVKLALTPTPVRSVATLLSALSLLTVLGLLIAATLARNRPGPQDQASTTARFSLRQAIFAAAIVAALALLLQPLAPLFGRRSPPGQVLGAQEAVSGTFGDAIELLAFDSYVRQVHPGSQLTVVLYWQTTAPLDKNYRVFLHLDGPDGQTYAAADELNPANIPTANWPPGLYVRNPLTLDLPETLPPIRYTLTAGLYDHHTGERLPVAQCTHCTISVESDANALPLANVWVLPTPPLTLDSIRHPLDYRFDENIELLGVDLSDPGVDGTLDLTLFWQANAELPKDYTVFVHAVDSDGSVLSQFDSPPWNGLYPTSAWLPQQIIADHHTIHLPQDATALWLGLYDPDTVMRLPVVGEDGVSQPNNAVVFPVPYEQ